MHASVRPSVRPSVRLSVRSSVHPSIRPSVHPSVRVSVRASVHASVCPCVSPCVCPPARPTIRPSVHVLVLACVRAIITSIIAQCPRGKALVGHVKARVSVRCSVVSIVRVNMPIDRHWACATHRQKALGQAMLNDYRHFYRASVKNADGDGGGEGLYRIHVARRWLAMSKSVSQCAM